MVHDFRQHQHQNHDDQHPICDTPLSGHTATKFDLSGFDIEINRERKDTETDDLTISLNSTVFAHDTMTAQQLHTIVDKYNALAHERREASAQQRQPCSHIRRADPSLERAYKLIDRLFANQVAQPLPRTIMKREGCSCHASPSGSFNSATGVLPLCVLALVDPYPSPRRSRKV